MYAENLTVLGGHDGFDVRTCDNVKVENCRFYTGDDCLAGFDNIGVHVDNCVFNCACSFMRFGGTDVLIENCIFAGTDIGVRFKSAMGRGGVVEDITIRNIQMNNIINEAIIFTMGYVLVNIEDEHENKEEKLDSEDIPEFKNIIMENINVSGCETAIKINGLKEKPIHDLSFNNINIKANKDIDISYAENINFNNVNILSLS